MFSVSKLYFFIHCPSVYRTTTANYSQQNSINSSKE